MQRYRRRSFVTTLMVLMVATPLAAVELARGTLWRVEQTCVLNARTTGAAFPCLAVDRDAGFAVLRAPFRQTHIVVMPIARMIGIEDPRLRGPAGTPLFAHAWDARHDVEAELAHPLAWNDIGLAVNSAFTRSQDQLHIHVDCVSLRVKRDLADKAAGFPTSEWQPDGYVIAGAHFWARRLSADALSDTNLAKMVDEIPTLSAHPDRTMLAVIGIDAPGGKPGFAVLAGESDPRRRAAQWTSEDMLDHHCRR